jgi:hypothetical protein
MEHEEFDNEKFEYQIDKAAEFIWEYLTPLLKERFDVDDIEEILNLATLYLETISLSGENGSLPEMPVEIDEEKMKYFIINEAVKSNIILNYTELDEILELEYSYMNLLGLIGSNGF